MRLIDADALIAEYDRVHVGEPGGARKLMEDAPTIEERKTGKWIWDGESQREYPYKCSECGKINYYAFLYDAETRAYKQQDNYCPNCGADMRRREQDE